MPRQERVADVYSPDDIVASPNVSDLTTIVCVPPDVIRASFPVTVSATLPSVNGAAASAPSASSLVPESATEETPASDPARVELRSILPPEIVTDGTFANVAVPASSSSPPEIEIDPVVALARSLNV